MRFYAKYIYPNTQRNDRYNFVVDGLDTYLSINTRLERNISRACGFCIEQFMQAVNDLHVRLLLRGDSNSNSSPASFLEFRSKHFHFLSVSC
jgi:hypothetical protein